MMVEAIPSAESENATIHYLYEGWKKTIFLSCK